MHRTYFWSWPLPDRASSGHVTLSLAIKKAPLGRIWLRFRLRMRRTYFRFRWLKALPITSLPIAPPHRSTANMTWAVPIYYLCPIIAILSFNSRVLLFWVVICLYCILWFTVDCLSGLCVLFLYLWFLFFIVFRIVRFCLCPPYQNKYNLNEEDNKRKE